MKKVQDALASLNIPVFALAWRATQTNPTAPNTYIVYTTNTAESDFRDDASAYDKVYVYLNLWMKSDPTTNAASVRTAMKTAGFELVSMEDEFQEDTGYYLVAFTFVTWV